MTVSLVIYVSTTCVSMAVTMMKTVPAVNRVEATNVSTHVLKTHVVQMPSALYPITEPLVLVAKVSFPVHLQKSLV